MDRRVTFLAAAVAFCGLLHCTHSAQAQNNQGAAIAAGILQGIANGLSGNQGGYYPGNQNGYYPQPGGAYYPPAGGYYPPSGNYPVAPQGGGSYPTSSGGYPGKSNASTSPKPVKIPPCGKPVPRTVAPAKPRSGGSDVLDINNRHENQGHKKPLEVRAQRTVESWGRGVGSRLGW